jgi:hypothetical protein
MAKLPEKLILLKAWEYLKFKKVSVIGREIINLTGFGSRHEKRDLNNLFR